MIDEWLEGPFRALIAPHMRADRDGYIRDRYEAKCCPLSMYAADAHRLYDPSIRTRMLAIMVEVGEAGR